MEKGSLVTFGVLFSMTMVSGIILSSCVASADDTETKNATVVVPGACSLSTISNGSYSATINNGSSSEINGSTISAVCNDTNGYSIYAIGYSGDSYYTNNDKLINSTSNDYNISTGTSTSGANSAWAMKVNPTSGNAPTITNSFSSYHNVPSTFTQVASYSSATTAGSTGSSLDTKYQVYISSTQPAGSYTGKVKYTLVHPNNAAAPTTPSIGPAPLEACNTPVPGNITYMQEITSENYATVLNGMEKNAPYYLRDRRDEEPYCVARMDDGTTDGTLWMTQNLRITGTVLATDSNFSTYDSVNVCEGDLTSGNDYNQPRCHNSGNTSNGVWYNYAAASAKTILGSGNSTEATEDICPAGWHLPNYDTNKPAGSVNSLAGISSVGVTAFRPVTGGRYRGGSIGNASSGYWWSSTAGDNNNRYNLSYNGSSLNTNNYTRTYGLYIRCTR